MMALVGTKIEVAQQGDGSTIGVKTDVVFDQRTGLMAEKKTLVADVPLEGGGTARIATEQTRVIATDAPPAYNQVTDGQGAPPSYEQVFGVRRMQSQVKEARDTSSNKGTFAVKFCEIVCGSAFCLVCLLIIAALPVTMIVIGAVYHDDCPAVPNLTNWLIVFGCFSLLQTTINIVGRCLCPKKKKDSQDDNENQSGRRCCSSLESLITLFLFAWIIVGSVWVFRFYDDWSSGTGGHCNSVPYLFTFITLIVFYSISGLFCLCCCCVFCCVAAVAGGED